MKSLQKKGQVRMMETIAILLVFFVIVIIVFLFVIRSSSITAGDKVQRSQELESIRVAQAISFLPELQCSSKNIVTENCFDKTKVTAFANLDTTLKDTYYNQLFFSLITVRSLNDGQEWTLYNRTRNAGSYTTITPISLYDPLKKRNDFGLMTITYYTS